MCVGVVSSYRVFGVLCDLSRCVECACSSKSAMQHAANEVSVPCGFRLDRIEAGLISGTLGGTGVVWCLKSRIENIKLVNDRSFDKNS